MPYIRKINLLLLFILLFSEAFSQEVKRNHDLVQFTGVILTADSLHPIPFAHVIVTRGYRGTVSDYNGYFSFVARKNDTIEFSAIGFKDEFFVIPDTISDHRYSIIQVMATDTIYLSETVIYPWPTKEAFKEAFLSLEIPDDDLEIARQNLDKDNIYIRLDNMRTDGSVTYKYTLNNYVDKLYYNGQTQPITILNPFAWAEFIKAWKDGKFKRKN
ncbi:MAG: carboxypeptidase-like regulatory domain-containing protein [Bacteroidetes bacterium]|nr:carboxypeptidase-like regulatory domain-containing protein [Bacteroidota bacterium]